MLADHLFPFGVRLPMSVAQTAHMTGVALCRVRQCLCAIRGHDVLLHFERRRLSLQCGTCGWNSPGWTIDARGPRSSTGDERLRAQRAPRSTSSCVSNRSERSVVKQAVGGRKLLVAK
jgi:hypothetical protein